MDLNSFVVKVLDCIFYFKKKQAQPDGIKKYHTRISDSNQLFYRIY
jgi:hypothetical protein